MINYFWINSRYSAKQLIDTQQYIINVTVSVCLDDICTNVPVINNVHVPILACNTAGSVVLPGDGTMDGYKQKLADTAGEEGIMKLLQHFDLQVSLD